MCLENENVHVLDTTVSIGCNECQQASTYVGHPTTSIPISALLIVDLTQVLILHPTLLYLQVPDDRTSDREPCRSS
jgi:hypothetical protein